MSASPALRPGGTRAPVGAAQDLSTGPGFGGVGRPPGIPAMFIGVTTQKFPVGTGALAASRACNAEHPVSRLCEWTDIFRALPPVDLETEVLVAPSYESNPVTRCLNRMGGLNCGLLPQRLPAACCGYPVPTAGPLSTLVLSPDIQIVSSCSDTFEFTVTALDVQGAPLEGITVFFEFPPLVGGTLLLTGLFSPAYAVTDATGTASSTLTLDASICAANCIGAACSAQVRARDLSGLVVSNTVPLEDNIP